jgi:hypothetical protein
MFKLPYNPLLTLYFFVNISVVYLCDDLRVVCNLYDGET